MNSLMNYGSDDECDVSSEEKQTDSYYSSRNYRKSGLPKQDDANYDEVQMSLSEDSSDESKPARDSSKQSREREDRHRDYEDRGSPKSKDDYRSSRKERIDRREDRYSGKSEREDDRSRHREDDRTRDRYRGDKDQDRERRDDRKGKTKEWYARDDRNRERKDRDRRRSRSPKDRERRRSRSPRRSERSRSKSKDKGASYSKRFDRANTKMERLDKMGIEIKTPDCQYVTPADLQKSMGEEKSENKDRFFVPGITGRFREQIEKRKLLWQKKETQTKPEAVPVVKPGGSRTTKVWEATTFAQDTDGKVANKFKRLMGIRNAGEGGTSASEVLKKQEEMFSSMEQQYEVARTATHTMRGVGLGFGSYQR